MTPATSTAVYLPTPELIFVVNTMLTDREIILRTSTVCRPCPNAAPSSRVLVFILECA